MHEQSAFIIRDGILDVPAWAWDSTQATLLGRTIIHARVVRGSIYEDDTWHYSAGCILSLTSGLQADIHWREGDATDRAFLSIADDEHAVVAQYSDLPPDQMLRLLTRFMDRDPRQDVHKGFLITELVNPDPSEQLLP